MYAIFIHYSNIWDPCLEVPGDKLTGIVPNLIEGNQYEFRIRAVNKAGPGTPSDPTNPVTARARNCKFASVKTTRYYSIFHWVIIIKLIAHSLIITQFASQWHQGSTAMP